MVDYVRKVFPNLNCVLDQSIESGCSRRRPDIYVDMGTFNLVIEVDENQHVHYTCENLRMMQIFQDGGSIPLVLIRFNPDSYVDTEGKRWGSCFGVDGKGALRVALTKQEEWSSRLAALKEMIEEVIKTDVPDKEVTVYRLFYTDETVQKDIADDSGDDRGSSSGSSGSADMLKEGVVGDEEEC